VLEVVRAAMVALISSNVNDNVVPLHETISDLQCRERGHVLTRPSTVIRISSIGDEQDILVASRYGISTY